MAIYMQIREGIISKERAIKLQTTNMGVDTRLYSGGNENQGARQFLLTS